MQLLVDAAAAKTAAEANQTTLATPGNFKADTTALTAATTALNNAIANLGSGDTVDTTALTEATVALNTAIENLGPGESVDLSNIPQYGDKQRIGDHEFTLTKAGAGAES